MKRFTLLLLPLIFFSCTKHYLCVTDSQTIVYSKPNQEDPLIFLPADKHLIKETPSKRGYYKVRVGTQEGYIVTTNFKIEHRYSKRDIYKLIYTDTQTYQNIGPSLNVFTSDTSKIRAKTTSTTSSSSGTVKVSGYYRKDGTYVRPHTRSAPRRKG